MLEIRGIEDKHLRCLGRIQTNRALIRCVTKQAHLLDILPFHDQIRFVQIFQVGVRCIYDKSITDIMVSFRFAFRSVISYFACKNLSLVKCTTGPRWYLRIGASSRRAYVKLRRWLAFSSNLGFSLCLYLAPLLRISPDPSPVFCCFEC